MSSVEIIVDGTVGVGKSALVEILAKELNLYPYREIYHDDMDLLNKFYNQGNKWCFPMQINFLTNRFKQYQEASLRTRVIMDRSIYCDPIFAKLYHVRGNITQEEYTVYSNLYKELIEQLSPPRLIVYLHVSPEEAIKRIRHRGRSGELKMDNDYWNQLHEQYTNHYSNFYIAPVLKLELDHIDYVNSQEDRKYIVEKVQKIWSDISFI